MAPTPARTKGTSQPTAGSQVETATPSSFVRGQRAVIEKVTPSPPNPRPRPHPARRRERGRRPRQREQGEELESDGGADDGGGAAGVEHRVDLDHVEANVPEGQMSALWTLPALANLPACLPGRLISRQTADDRQRLAG